MLSIKRNTNIKQTKYTSYIMQVDELDADHEWHHQRSEASVYYTNFVHLGLKIKKSIRQTTSFKSIIRPHQEYNFNNANTKHKKTGAFVPTNLGVISGYSDFEHHDLNNKHNGVGQLHEAVDNFCR
jgi:hypothetical protein